ncbi:MAG: nucleotide-binding protein [Melioribacteraceae bacterium]|nr:MAG: nucleotide-binding protein [Melioribacteraceae bacterium]
MEKNMDTKEKLDLIESLIEEIQKMPYRNSSILDKVNRRAEMIIRNIYGEKSKYLKDLQTIDFYPNWAPSDESDKRKYWQSGVDEMMNLFNILKEELNLFISSKKTKIENEQSQTITNRVFIVHGKDNEMKLAVARTLDKLGLTAVILHEQPNQGRTIIEKFTDYSDVSFAVVLFSPDDEARPRGDDSAQLRPRARQNVVLELGYFLGKLSRQRVLALFKQTKDFETPSDYSGVIFVPFDDAGRWQFDLLKELKACNYNVDANNLL